MNAVQGISASMYGEMQGTVHKCLVQNHRIHAFCGVEIEVVGDNCVVVLAGEDDGSPRERFGLSSVPYTRNGTGYLQICFHCLDKLRGNSAKSSHEASTSSTKETKSNESSNHKEFSVSTEEELWYVCNEDLSGVELFEFYINNCDESELRNDKDILNDIKHLKAVNDPRDGRLDRGGD